MNERLISVWQLVVSWDLILPRWAQLITDDLHHKSIPHTSDNNESPQHGWQRHITKLLWKQWGHLSMRLQAPCSFLFHVSSYQWLSSWLNYKHIYKHQRLDLWNHPKLTVATLTVTQSRMHPGNSRSMGLHPLLCFHRISGVGTKAKPRRQKLPPFGSEIWPVATE